MDLIKKYSEKASALSIEQYCPPRCFELEDKRFSLVIDTGECCGEAELYFPDRRHVEFRVCGEPETRTAEYECRKGDDDTYLVTYCIEGEKRENQTWILDMEQELVTFLRCPVGENPVWPWLIDSHFGFGYICVDGKPHPDRRRHGFTGDVVGTSVKWTYGHELKTVHVYYSPAWYRISYPKDEVMGDNAMATNEMLNDLLKDLPSSDEPAYYVKIKEGMYLVSVTEQNNEKIIGERIGVHSDTLCFLDNWNRFTSVGRGYGTNTNGGEVKSIFVMIGKYASPTEVDPHFFTDPNPYLV